jgi:hypothetical protein
MALQNWTLVETFMTFLIKMSKFLKIEIIWFLKIFSHFNLFDWHDDIQKKATQQNYIYQNDMYWKDTKLNGIRQNVLAE